MKLKRIISSIISLSIMLGCMNIYAEDIVFLDVPTDSELYGDAQFLKNLGIIEGIGDNMLAPEATVIRADFAVMIDKTLNPEASGLNVFYDCPDNSYFAQAVNRVAKNGIINGYDDGSFKPHNKINKQEAATILVRAYENEIGKLVFAKNAAKSFKDYEEIAVWAKDYIDKAYILGLIKPANENYMGAADDFTRGEAVSAISKLILTMSEKKQSDFGAKNNIIQWNRGNIFVGDEPMGFTLETGNDLVEYAVTDYNNKVIEHSAKIVKDGKVDFEFTGYDPGYYEVGIFCADDGGIKHEIARTSMCLLEEYDFKGVPAENSVFAINMHPDRSFNGWRYDLLKEANIIGARHIRSGYEWKDIETTKGDYTAKKATIENYFNILNNYGMSVLIVTGFINKFYDNGATPYTDLGRQAFANHSKSYFDMYEGNQSQEMYNEFWGPQFGDRGDGPADGLPEYYVPLLKTTYTTIKAAHPDAVLSFCVGHNDWSGYSNWRRRVFELGGLDYCDVVNLHKYGAGKDAEISLEEDIRIECKALRDDIYEFAPDKINLPLWVTETGANTSTNKYGKAEDEVAREIPRIHAIYQAEGASRVYFYDLLDEGNRDSEHEDRYGLLRAFGSKFGSYTPKPSFVSYGAIARQITGYDCISDDSLENGIEWFKFVNGNKTVNMIYTRGLPSKQQYTDVAIYTDDAVKITDIMGNSKNYTPVDGRIYLTLNGDPIYISGNVSDIKEERIVEITPDDWIPVGKRYSIATKAVGTASDGVTLNLDGREYGMGEIATADEFVLKGTRNIVLELTKDGQRCGRLVVPVTAEDNYNLSVETRVEPNGDKFESIFKFNFQNNAPYTVNARSVLISVDDETVEKPINKIVDAKETNSFEIDMGEATLRTSHKFSARMNVDDVLSDVIDAEGNFQNNAIKKRTIDVDGILDDGMEEEDYFLITKDAEISSLASDGSRYGGDNDFSGKVWITYDEENFYITAEVLDDEHSSRSDGSSIWRNDSVQIDFYQHETEGYDILKGYTEVGVSLLDKGTVGTWCWHSVKEFQDPLNIDGLVTAVKRDESKKITVYEVAVSWKETGGIDVDSISRIDISVAFNDCDNGVRQTAFELGGGVIQAKNPSKYTKYSLIR